MGIGQYFLPTSHSEGASWVDPEYAYDGNLSTGAHHTESSDWGWGEWLNLLPDEPEICTAVMWNMNIGPGGTAGSIQVQAEVDGVWINIYNEYCRINTPTWFEESVSGLVTGVRFRNQGRFGAADPRISVWDCYIKVQGRPGFIKFIGTAAVGDITRSLVDEGDQAGQARAGWLKIEITDLGDQVADGDYYIPIHMLS